MAPYEVPEAVSTLPEPLFVTLSSCPDGENHQWGGGAVLLKNHDQQVVSSETCARCGLPQYDYNFFVQEAVP